MKEYETEQIGVALVKLTWGSTRAGSEWPMRTVAGIVLVS